MYYCGAVSSAPYAGYYPYFAQQVYCMQTLVSTVCNFLLLIGLEANTSSCSQRNAMRQLGAAEHITTAKTTSKLYYSWRVSPFGSSYCQLFFFFDLYQLLSFNVNMPPKKATQVKGDEGK
jgi:hypothetical protein